MQFFRVYLKYCFTIFFLFTQISISAAQLSRQELKDKIVDNIFPKEIFEDYEFHLINNKIEFDQELNFLSELKSSFETEYLQGLILFKKNDYSESFKKLLSLVDNPPNYYPYYDILVKTARITNNNSKVENSLDKIDFLKYKNYLQAQLLYQKSQYEDAKVKFNEVLQIDSTSFDVLYMMAYTQRNLGDYDSALKYFNKATGVLEKDDPLTAKVTIAIGSLFYLSDNYDRAKELYNKGQKIAAELGYTSERIKALLNLGMILDEEGKIEKARSNFDEASKLAAFIDDTELEAIILSEYAVSYTYTDERIKAREKYEKSLILFGKLKNKNRFAFTANNIGHIYLNIANYKSAIKYYEMGLDEAGENVKIKMHALRGLGEVYTNLSDYSKALNYYTLAKELAKKIKDISADATINIGLGILYYNLDMPHKALKILKESENSLSESENPYLKLEIEQKIGIVYNSMDSLSLAHAYLNNSANLASKYGDIYSEILSNTFLADILIKQENLSEAYSLLNKTITTTGEIEDDQLLGLQSLIMSDIYKFKSDHTNQIKYLERAKVYAEKSHEYKDLIEVNQKLGEIYERNNELEKAKEYYQTAIDIIDNNFNLLFSKADIQIKFFSNYYSVYNSLINLYLSENNFEKAFETLEKSKARNTNQNLVNLKLENSKGKEELLAKYYDLAWNLNSGYYNQNEMDSINNELLTLKDSIAQIDPVLKKYLNNNQFSINDIQDNLENDQYIISYFVQDNYLYAFQLSIEGLKTKRINIPTKQLDDIKNKISPYYNNKIGGNEISFNKDLFAFNADGANLFYQNIVEPIISDIPINSKLIFSLPPEMLTIPFEFLVTGKAKDSSPYLLDNKKFLIDYYVISYTPSASIWSELKNMNHLETHTALLIGDPFFEDNNQSKSELRGVTDEINLFSRNMNHQRLEYSEEEIQSIGSLLSNDNMFLSRNATETIFKNNVEDASIVHLSTHSFLYKKNPLILFSNTDKENDGFLEVGEILNLHLKSDMVVLSSCKSGLGKVDKAEGIIGMQKAFFDAGARSVVVSLWDVNDKYTSIFMKYFYSFLSEGYSKSEALRFAKLKFIKLNNSNPYYWSAFTISGNDKPFQIKITDFTFLYAITGLFLLIGLIFSIIYFQKFRTGLVFKSN